MASIYQIQLPIFEGPLDLLLQLIEREELDVTKIALAKVTDQYLAHLRRIPEHHLEELASFLVIAARLLQIKSEALLPRPPIRETGEEDPGEALARQLIVYRRFKEIASLLDERERAGVKTYLRLSAPPAPEPKLDLNGLGTEDLLQAMVEALAAAPAVQGLEEVITPPRIRIRDKVRLILEAIRGRGKMSFLRLLQGAGSRLEIVISFLAVLELEKTNRVQARQESPFGDIELLPGEAWQEDQEADFALEFEE